MNESNGLKLTPVYVKMSNRKIEETMKIGGAIVDFAADGEIVGIEFANPISVTLDGHQATLPYHVIADKYRLVSED